MPSLPGLTQQADPPPLGMACSVSKEQGDPLKHLGKLCDGQLIFFRWLPSSVASPLQHRLTLQQQHFLSAKCCLHHFLSSQGSQGKCIESTDITNTEPSKHRLSSPTSLIWTGKMHIYLIPLHLEHSNSYCTRCFQPNPRGFQEMWCPLLGSPHPADCG